jgi:hypothetical protein
MFSPSGSPTCGALIAGPATTGSRPEAARWGRKRRSATPRAPAAAGRRRPKPVSQKSVTRYPVITRLRYRVATACRQFGNHGDRGATRGSAAAVAPAALFPRRGPGRARPAGLPTPAEPRPASGTAVARARRRLVGKGQIGGERRGRSGSRGRLIGGLGGHPCPRRRPAARRQPDHAFRQRRPPQGPGGHPGDLRARPVGVVGNDHGLPQRPGRRRAARRAGRGPGQEALQAPAARDRAKSGVP